MITRALKAIAEPVLLIGASLLIVEIACRVWVHFFYFIPAPSTELLTEPDAALGWRNKPGQYLLYPYRQDATLAPEPYGITINSDGSRGAPGGGRQVVDYFFGCSFTHGFAVDDSQTIPALFEKKSEAGALNFGVPGYGTLQALQLMKNILPQSLPPETVVFYLYLDSHDDRTVVEPYWMSWLFHPYSMRPLIGSVPYCDWGAAGVRCFPPTEYPHVPFRDWLMISRVIGDVIYTVGSRQRVSHKREISRVLMSQMNDLVKSRGGRLVVIFLLSDDAVLKSHADFLRAQGIDYLDCRDERFEQASMRQGDNLHPNGTMNEIYADCLSRAQTSMAAQPQSGGGSPKL